MDRKRLLMGNNNGANSTQILLDGAQLRLDNLTHSVIPVAGAVTPSMTRSTTATCVDSWGRQITALAGELRFPGARRVANLFVLGTENFSTANWTKSNGSFSGSTFTASGASAGFYQTPTVLSGRTYLLWAKLSCASGTVATGLFANGTPASPNPTTSSITVTTTPTVFQLLVTTTAAGNMNAGVGVYNAIPNGSSVTVHQIQLEDVTGQSVQTAGEYVSVGALDYRSTLNPLYLSLPGTAGHYVSTPDTAANSIVGDIAVVLDISANDLTNGNQSPIGKIQTLTTRSWFTQFDGAGTPSFTNSTDGTAGTQVVGTATATLGSVGISDGQRFQLAYTLDVDNGAGGRVNKFFWSVDGGVTWTQLGATVTQAGTTSIFDSNSVVEIGGLVLGTLQNFAGKVYSAQVYNGIPPMLGGSGSAAPVVDFNPHRDATTPTGTITSSATGEVWTINGASSVVRSAAYHGSMVDGVKCFPTDLSGNTLTGMTTPLIELAATQLIAATDDIRDMTTASWTLGATMTRARTSVGWDGAANTATRLTGGAVAATNTITYTLVAAASSRTYSVGIKRITGTGPVRLTQDNFATSTDISSQLTTAGYTLVQLNQSQLNAVFGIKIDTNGDAIDVDMNQFEAGAFATSRILTGGATRTADQFYYTGALIGTLKTLAVRGFKREVGFNNVGVIAALTDGTAANFNEIYLNGPTSPLTFGGNAASAIQWNTVASNAYTPGALSNAAWSFATNDIKMAKDGVAQTPDTSATIPTVTRLEIGMSGGAFQLNGYPGKIYGWTRNLSQSEVNGVSA